MLLFLYCNVAINVLLLLCYLKEVAFPVGIQPTTSHGRGHLLLEDVLGSNLASLLLVLLLLQCYCYCTAMLLLLYCYCYVT